jgi:hypothetical protein
MKHLLIATLLLASTAHAQLTPHHHEAAHQIPGTLVIPAADFLATIPAGDSNDGRFPANTWFFNDSTLNMATATDLTATLNVPAPATYHLFVRAIGTPTSSFRVSINGQLDPGTYGRGPLAFTRGADFTLPAGPAQIRITSIQPRPSLNVLVLTTNPAFTEDDLRPLELPPEVKLLHEYKIAPSNIVKFGDVDGSGKYAIVDILNDYSTIVYANDGHELWRWQAPPTTPGDPRGNEAAGVLWDFHQTGRDELAHWRLIDGKEYVVLADGRTGAILHKAPWPAPDLPHVDNNYRMAVARFHKESPGPDTLLVFADTGGFISLTAYDRDLNLLWQHAEHRDKDYFGHYIYPFDIDGDGIDEVVISHLCLDAHGKEIWNNAKYFEKNNDHMDAMEFFDLNGDGHPALLVGQSDVGTLAYNARTGTILWQNLSDHTQQVTAGYILSGSKTPQVVSNGRTYVPQPPRPAGVPGTPRARPTVPADQIAFGGGLGAQLYWFDSAGHLLERWPANPLSGNPNFVHGNWFGNGTLTYFWFRFKLEPDGAATQYFKGEAYHMFDFDHIGHDQVLTLDNAAPNAKQTLRIYAYANATSHPQTCNQTCRKQIANHTHY